tara:strand:+ start:223 stop:744 length:522 start_codon:yes stop_codon:yes gene_type:complete
MIKLQDMLKEMSISNPKEIYGTIKPKDRIIMSEEEIITPRNTLQKKEGFKPRGLWYALGSEWWDWMEREMPKWIDDYNFVFKLELHEDMILKLGHDISHSEFEELYGIVKYGDGVVSDINWFKVQLDLMKENKYGIEIIAPFGSIGSWLRPWDISSGCVWGEKAIKDIVKIEI